MSSVVAAAVVLDLLLLSLLTWAIARGGGVTIWPIRSPESGLCLALPLIIVMGSWGAHAFTLQHIRSFASHLGRTAGGALAAALFAFAVYLATGGQAVSQMIFITASALVLVIALHANYLGVVRSMARAGILALPSPNPET